MLAAMLTVSLVAMLAAGAAWQQWRTVEVESTERQHAQAQWLLLGALLAAPVFASTVVALPMLVDTRASVMEAVTESWRAVASHSLAV